MCACALIPQVRLYMDCEEYHRVAFARSPQPLTFESSSGIFVGNAGGTGLARFVVSVDGTGFVVVVCILVHTVIPCNMSAPGFSCSVSQLSSLH